MPEAKYRQQSLEFSTTRWKPQGIIHPLCPKPILNTGLGILFQGDCLEILKHIESESVDTVFADPPFNLGKQYGKTVNDQLSESDYINWMHSWIAECERVLRPGGSLFIYNLPK